jgi:hypothetical protein
MSIDFTEMLFQKYGRPLLSLEETSTFLGITAEGVGELVATGQLIVKTIGDNIWVSVNMLGDFLALNRSLDTLPIQSYSATPNDVEITMEEADIMSKRPKGTGSIIWNKDRNRYQAMFFYEEDG